MQAHECTGNQNACQCVGLHMQMMGIEPDGENFNQRTISSGILVSLKFENWKVRFASPGGLVFGQAD